MNLCCLLACRQKASSSPHTSNGICVLCSPFTCVKWKPGRLDVSSKHSVCIITHIRAHTHSCILTHTQGPRPGLAFRSGPQGLGYYPDSEHQGIRAPSQPGASGKGKQQQQQQKGVRIAGMPSTTPAAAQHAAAAGEGAGVGAKGGEDRAKTGGDRGRAEVDRDSSSDDEVRACVRVCVLVC